MGAREEAESGVTLRRVDSVKMDSHVEHGAGHVKISDVAEGVCVPSKSVPRPGESAVSTAGQGRLNVVVDDHSIFLKLAKPHSVARR